MNIKNDMSIVIVGHVDHGKSTIIGRMLADTDSLPEGKLAQVKETCRRNSKPFEYAFLLDALKDEQAQGITIDTARCFFSTEKRDYIILDAPGHIEFLKNMVTGAARAEAAILVIDAKEGIQENSKRHGYMLSMLGIKQVTVAINKMDLVDYNENIYNQIKNDYTTFLKKINISPKTFIPVSGMFGDNIATLSPNMPWYNEETILSVLDNFETEALPINKPFRMPVQDIYKFTKGGDDRRIVAGSVLSGQAKVGDDVIFYPSGKKSRIKSFEKFSAKIPTMIKVGEAVGFTLEEQIYIKRGDVAVLEAEEPPKVTSRVKANLFWLGKEPMIKGKDYYFKLGTSKVTVKLEEISRVIDASNLNNSVKEKVQRHDVAEVILKFEKAIAFDLMASIAETSRFVIVDNYEIAGGGIIQMDLKDSQSQHRKRVINRNIKWEKSMITPEERAEKYNQKSSLILITGGKDVGKKPLAKALEKKLFTDGKIVYFLGIGNLLYGVDADIKLKEVNHKEEHLRRLAEVSNIMLDAGGILIVTAINLSPEDLDLIKTTLNNDRIIKVWIGEENTVDLPCDLQLNEDYNMEYATNKIKNLLHEKNVIFNPFR